MQKGKIGVTTENIFPIIKKFLYSDHEIFLRELVSNAVDASQKLKTLSSVGEFTGDINDLQVSVAVDKEAKTITITDNGIGMTNEEIDKFINQIAFSSAETFLEKYKDQASAIIGHFGLGFYSAFMVSKQVDIHTKSWKEGSAAMKWSCDGSPEYSLVELEKETRGTTITLHIDDESEEFLEESKIQELLSKYCKFLPITIVFGNKTEWKDGASVETDEPNIINDTNPAWTRKPADLKEDDYNKFYNQLYPAGEDPLFNIHLNVDYPFNLTGILYFPKINNSIEIQKNKIQLYCNQVYVTDSVEGIVPEFLTLLHGVIDSPDIPLNVSRSYLQSDRNVKKISSHITKKVADRLNSIFKEDRAAFEDKWDDLKLFIQYGMISDEKFYEKAIKFALLKNSEGKCFTFDEYKELVKPNQTDKDGKLVYLYTSDRDEQYSFIEAAKTKGYDVLVFDGQLDSHFINQQEQKDQNVRYVRVDSDVASKLIPKDEVIESKLSAEDQANVKTAFEGIVPTAPYYSVTFENLDETELPIMITRNEFMRRMKDMSKLGGNQMGFYGDMLESLNLVLNSNHAKIAEINKDLTANLSDKIAALNEEIITANKEVEAVAATQKDKKEEEIVQAEKDALEEAKKIASDKESAKSELLKSFGKENKQVKQLFDLALLANNMLKGEELSKFIARSVELL